MPEENIRLQIMVSPAIYQKLSDWGKYHGKSPSAFAGQIVSSRVESNLELIEKLKNDMEQTGTDPILRESEQD